MRDPLSLRNVQTKIKNGYQVETPDNWLQNGNPFEIRRDEYAKEVRFGGTIRMQHNYETGRDEFIQENFESVLAIPYDMPIVGYGNNVVNTLRIWDAKAITSFRLDSFDRGEYHKAVEQENLAKTIVEVLYPNDNHYAGKELRLKQQYFFISASLQEAIDKYKRSNDDIRRLHEKVIFQMNDTHPTVAVAELMRLLMDEEGLSWMMHGMLQQNVVHTQTIRSCLRRLRNGRSICSPDCFREYIRL